jgi:hypothetical protein
MQSLLRRHERTVRAYLVRRARPFTARVRVDHALMLRVFVETGSYTLTAFECGVGAERIRQLVAGAMRYLRAIGKAPPLRSRPRKDGSSSQRSSRRLR